MSFKNQSERCLRSQPVVGAGPARDSLRIIQDHLVIRVDNILIHIKLIVIAVRIRVNRVHRHLAIHGKLPIISNIDKMINGLPVYCLRIFNAIARVCRAPELSRNAGSSANRLTAVL